MNIKLVMSSGDFYIGSCLCVIKQSNDVCVRTDSEELYFYGEIGNLTIDNQYIDIKWTLSDRVVMI